MLWKKFIENAVFFNSLLTIENIILVLIHIHEAVGTGIMIAAYSLSLQLFPGGFRDRYVIKLEPALALFAINICPVVTRGCLALMNKHSMQAVRMLRTETKDLKGKW